MNTNDWETYRHYNDMCQPELKYSEFRFCPMSNSNFGWTEVAHVVNQIAQSIGVPQHFKKAIACGII